VSRVAWIVGAVLGLLGVFWSGRESTHGMAAFWEHWWCPIPLVVVVVGIASVAVAWLRRTA
jgi:hypothetical protein